MREIKFRYLWKDNWYYIDFQKDNLGLKFKEFEERAKTTRLQLWTGLKDKNGKEIYKGDIFKFKVNDKEYYFVVKWGDEQCGWMLNVVEQESSLDFLLNYPLFELNRFFNEDINKKNKKIIGNIYENPELLGGNLGEKEMSEYYEKQDKEYFGENANPDKDEVEK